MVHDFVRAFVLPLRHSCYVRARGTDLALIWIYLLPEPATESPATGAG